MFFRREQPRNPTFTERLESLPGAGFRVDRLPGGTVRVSRDGCAVDLKEETGGVFAAPGAGVPGAGVLINGEIAALVDGGYQKFFRAPSGEKKPATAGELKALHEFEEDLKEGLGQQSYYNESLGTVSTFYLYDRVKGRG